MANLPPIGLTSKERAELCLTAAHDLCQHAGSHVMKTVQVRNQDASAEPYVRAVYSCSTSRLTLQRVSVASGEECGSRLRDALRETVANVAGTRVACWLTVVLKDGCIAEQALFALSSVIPQPQNWSSPPAFNADRASSYRPGTLRWSLPKTKAAAKRDTSEGGIVHTPRDEDLVISAPPSVHKRDTVPPAAQTKPSPAAAATATIARPSGTQPCAHSARTLAKAMAAVNAQQDSSTPRMSRPPSIAPGSASALRQPARSAAEPVKIQHRDNGARTPKSGQSSNVPTAASRPRPASQGDATPSEVSSAAAPAPPSRPISRHDAATDRSRHHPSGQVSSNASALQGSRQANNCRSDVVPSPSPASHNKHGGLIVYDSPQPELVVPSDGRQWGDFAYRTTHAVRREELWNIADAVMTHNYHVDVIEAGEQPARIEDRPH